MMPITVLISAIALAHIISLLRIILVESKEADLSNYLTVGLWTASSVLLLIMMMRRNRRAFFYSAIAVCVLIISSQTLHTFMQHAEYEISIMVQILNIITNFVFILLLFLLFYYKDSFLSNEKSEKDIIPLLATFMIAGGFHFFSYYMIEIGYFQFSIILGPLLQVVIGIGLFARDRFFGIFGSFAWLLLSFFSHSYILDSLNLENILLLLQVSVFKISFVIILIYLSKDCFIRNSMAAFFEATSDSGVGYGSTSSLTSKSCSRCGREVPLSSARGQTCPHCGAYWSDERTIQGG